MNAAPVPLPADGFTINEVAERFLRCQPRKVRALIASGRLVAVDTNTGTGAKRRYVVTLAEIEKFQRRHATTPATLPLRARKGEEPSGAVDFFPKK